MSSNARASSTLARSTNTNSNNMNDKFSIGIDQYGCVVVEMPDGEIITFPKEISNLLFYTMLTYNLNKNNNKSKSNLQVC